MAAPIRREERAGQIGPAPFARAGVHVEVEEGVPVLLGRMAAPVSSSIVDAVASASRRSRLMVLRLRDAKAAEKIVEIA